MRFTLGLGRKNLSEFEAFIETFPKGRMVFSTIFLT